MSDAHQDEDDVLKFSDHFWGKDDAGLAPMLERQHNSKTTCDELKTYYNIRAAIEDDYARKLLTLSRKPLGSRESATLRESLEAVRLETKNLGDTHSTIASQMKSDLEDPLAAISAAMRERRRVVQTAVEKLSKLKSQQTAVVNKTRDRYEQDCLRLKGCLAQKWMAKVGQDERKNKHKLEKTQQQLQLDSNEYETALKNLDETTTRWNKEWPAACDKFQALEHERLAFTRTSLWEYANIASTACVNDDAALERIRLHLEGCVAEADLNLFVKEQGTGTDVPVAPKFIDFYQGGAPPDDPDLSENDEPAPPASSYEPYEGQPGPHDSRKVRLPKDAASRDRPSRGIQDDAAGNPDVFSATNNAPRSQSRGNQRDLLNEHNLAEPSQTSPTKAPGSTPSSPSKSSPRKGFFSNSPFRRRSKHGSVHDSDSPRSPWIKPGANQDGSQFDDEFAPTAADSEPSSDPIDPRANLQLNVGNNVFDVSSPDKRKTTGQLPTKPANESETGDPMIQALADLKGGAQAGDRNKSLKPTRSSLRMNHGIPTPTMSGTNAFPPGVDPNAPPQMGTPASSYSDSAQGKRLDAPKPAYTSAQMQRTTQSYAGRTQGVFNQAMVPPTPTSPMQSATSPRAPSPQKQQYANPAYVAHGGHQQAPGSSPLDRRGSRVEIQKGQPQPHGNPYARHTSPGPGTRIPIQSGQGNVRAGVDSNARGQRFPPRGSFSSPQHQQQQQHPAEYSPRPNTQQSIHLPRGLSPGPTYQPYQSSGSVSSQPQYASSRPASGHGGGNLADFAPDDGYRAHNRGTWGSPQSQSQSHSHSHPHSHSATATSRTRAQSFVAPEQRLPKVASDGRPILHFARALYNFRPQIPEELEFNRGDRLAILVHQDDGWWDAEILGGEPGRIGLVPGNHLAALDG